MPTSELNETINLLGQARAGDRGAADNLFFKIGPRLEAIVRLRLGYRLRTKMETLDVVQDAMLAALPHLEVKQFNSSGEFFHWLSALLENRIRDLADHFGAAKRNTERERPLEAPAGGEDTRLGPIAGLARGDTPSMIAAGREEACRLEQAIDELPEDQREALILVRYTGMSLAEAGQEMNRSADAVRMLVSRAIVRLGSLLVSTDSLT